MRIESLTLRELRMALRAPFETSFGVTRERRILLAEAVADGVAGWGEITAGEGPFYGPETTETAWHVVRDFIAPLALGKKLASAAELAALLAPIRGHPMAKAGVESTLWDIEAQQKGLPLAKLLGGTLEEIPCGVSLGIQPTVEGLLEKIEKELAAGYQRIKIKIKPGWDVAVVSAVRKRFPGVKLMVDANSAYSLRDTAHLQQLDAFYLMMLEQPLAWDDIHEHAKLQAQLQTPICLDESIHNARQARAAIELGACQIINIKLGRVGGYAEARRVHDVCREHSVPVWCGAMLESGVGRAHNIALSTLPNFLLPGDVSASRRYWEEDIIEPEVEVTPEGTIRVPTAPGLGFAVRRERIEKLTVRRETWSAS
ncbi:MAG: o-succinylbenzoate synthase [Acidobacteria bacterium]|nr:o-succinylbenzoate synthase [Acidobacteriota bacterium]